MNTYLYLLLSNRAAVAESKDCKLSHLTKSKGRRGVRILRADLKTNAWVQYLLASPSMSCQLI